MLNLELFERAVLRDPGLTRDPVVVTFLNLMQHRPDDFNRLLLSLLRQLVACKNSLLLELRELREKGSQPVIFLVPESDEWPRGEVKGVGE